MFPCMAAGVATDQKIELSFYSAGDCVLILAAWDDEEGEEELEAEVLAKYFALRCGEL